MSCLKLCVRRGFPSLPLSAALLSGAAAQSLSISGLYQQGQTYILRRIGGFEISTHAYTSWSHLCLDMCVYFMLEYCWSYTAQIMLSGGMVPAATWWSSLHLLGLIVCQEVEVFVCVFKICLFIWRTVTGEERTEIHRYFSLVHSPKDHNSQIWVRRKPGARNSICVSPMGGRELSTWAILCCLFGTLAGVLQ